MALWNKNLILILKFCGVHIPSQIHRLLDRTTAPQLRLTCASGRESGAWNGREGGVQRLVDSRPRSSDSGTWTPSLPRRWSLCRPSQVRNSPPGPKLGLPTLTVAAVVGHCRSLTSGRCMFLKATLNMPWAAGFSKRKIKTLYGNNFYWNNLANEVLQILYKNYDHFSSHNTLFWTRSLQLQYYINSLNNHHCTDRFSYCSALKMT